MSEYLEDHNTIAAAAHLWNSYDKKKRSYLSKARFTKLLYLSDWVKVLNFGSQVTNVNWYFNHFGPYVDLKDVLCNSLLFEINEFKDKDKGVIRNYVPVGTVKVITLPEGMEDVNKDSKRCIDEAIKLTQYMDWKDFIDYIYRTPPVFQGPQYTHLDLEFVSKAISGTPYLAK